MHAIQYRLYTLIVAWLIWIKAENDTLWRFPVIMYILCCIFQHLKYTSQSVLCIFGIQVDTAEQVSLYTLGSGDSIAPRPFTQPSMRSQPITKSLKTAFSFF